jgi:hypothetical protein
VLEHLNRLTTTQPDKEVRIMANADSTATTHEELRRSRAGGRFESKEMFIAHLNMIIEDLERLPFRFGGGHELKIFGDKTIWIDESSFSEIKSATSQLNKAISKARIVCRSKANLTLVKGGRSHG